MRSQPTADRSATTATDQETMKFRAATLDEAVAAAETALGGKVKVLEANKIRRGGIGGFFASDLGVEVTVRPETETIEDALERLVARSDADDRGRWSARALRADAAETAELPPTFETLDEDIEVDVPAPEMSMKALRKMADLSALAATVQPATPTPIDEAPTQVLRAARRLHPATEMVSAQDIVAELRSLTGEPEVSFSRVQEIADLLTSRPTEESAPAPAPKLASPARKKLGSPVATKVAEPVAAESVVMAEPVVMATPVVVAAPVAAEPVVIAEPVVVATPVIETHVETVALRQPELVPASAIDVMPPAIRRPAGAPSRRHVELTLAAADQLIDSLSRSGKVQRLSVRVVLRSGDQREVEAEAQWEAAPSNVTDASATEAA